MAGKRPHDRKPYDRHAHGSQASSSRWRSTTSTYDSNEANESFISQMTNSVTGLFSKSWRISDWFKSKRNDFSPSKAPEAALQGGESISTHPEGESFIFTKTEMKSPSFKPIYPEEGVSDEREPIASTSEASLKDQRRNRRLDGEAPEFLLPENRGSFPCLRTNHPIIASTPAPSSSKEATNERKLTVVLDEDQELESLPELEDVSLIAHRGNETTLREEFDADDKSSTLSTSAHYSLGGRPPLPDRKRRRDSLEELSRPVADNDDDGTSNSLHQTPSILPQPGAMANKRPRFSLSTYTSPINNSSFMDSSSLFYPGRTMYGGASNFRRSKCTPFTSKSVPQAQVRVQKANHTPDDGGLSLAAKRILDCLNKMSTPLTNAKRIPSSRPKTYLFDSPSYIADFHRHRPTLRADRTPGSTPPTTKLLTPSKVPLKENVSSLLEPSPVPKTKSPLDNPAPPTLSPATSKAATQIPVSVIVTSKEETTLQPPVQTPSFSFGVSSTSTKVIPKPSFAVMAEVHSSPKEDLRKATSFKIKPSKKGSESIMDEAVVVPNLPRISFSINSMPKIDFGLDKPPIATSSSSDEIGAFQFSAPNVLVSSPLDVLPDDNMDGLDDFVFRQPLLENEDHSSHGNKAKGSQASQLGSRANERSSVESSAPKSASPSTKASIKTPPPTEILTFSTPPTWGDKFKPSKDSWECDICLLRNKSIDDSCVACQSPRPCSIKPANAAAIPGQGPKLGSSAPPPYPSTEKTPSSSSGFGDLFKKPSNEWTCDVCMINNKNDVDTCIACQSAKPGSKASSLSQPTPKVSSKSSGFGDLFKKPSNEWTCDVCMINNKNEVNQCVACQTFKPGANVGFGAQFQMPKDEWECSTCLVRNKNSTKKCLSCSTPLNKENEDIVSKAMTGNFKFGVGSNSFKFGIPKTDTSQTAAEFKFGVQTSAPVSSTTSNVNDTGNLGFKFNASSTAETSKTFSFGLSTQSPAAAATTATTSKPLNTSLTTSDAIGKETPLNAVLSSSTASSDTSISKSGTAFSSSFPGFSFKTKEVKLVEPVEAKDTTKISFGGEFSSSSVVVPSLSSVVTTASSLSKNLSKSPFVPTTASICSVIVTSPKAASMPVRSSPTFSSLTSSSSVFSSPIPSTTFPPFSAPSSTCSSLPPSSTISSTLFSFGNSSTYSITPTSTSTKFSFGNTSTTGMLIFSSSASSLHGGQTTLTPSTTSFKSETSKSVPSAFAPSLGTHSSPSTSLSSFSSVPTSNSSKLAFGGTPSTNVFSFGQSGNSGGHQAPSTKSGFSFGNPSVSFAPSSSTATPASTSSIFSFGSTSHAPVNAGFNFSNTTTASSFFSGLTGTSPFTSSSTQAAASTTTTSSSTPCFAFGQTQEKKNNAGFNFGQASASTGSSNFNFNFAGSAPTGQNQGGMFAFQGSSAFSPRTNSGDASKEISASAFSMPTENAFSILSSSNPPHNRVIKTAKRRGKK